MKEYEEYLNKIKKWEKVILQEVLYDLEDKLVDNTIYHIFELDSDKKIRYKLKNGDITHEKWVLTEEKFKETLKKLL